MTKHNLNFELYPDEITDPSLVEAETMAYEIPTPDPHELCDAFDFCGGDGCIGCSTSWTCFPVSPWKTWDTMTPEDKEIIRTYYPAWIGR